MAAEGTLGTKENADNFVKSHQTKNNDAYFYYYIAFKEHILKNYYYVCTHNYPIQNNMKKTNFLALFASLILVFTSCKKEEDSVNSKGQFNIQISESDITSSLKSTSDTVTTISKFILTVKNDKGAVVINDSAFNVLKFGTSYISEAISLPTGNYYIEKFMVLSGNSVVYASPLKNSAKAYLVNKSLPINFALTKDNVTKITPEVLNCQQSNPGDFGYNAFGFQLIKTFDFLVTTYIYKEDINNYALTDANILITLKNDTAYKGTLLAATNKLTLKESDSTFNVTITKENYKTYSKQFTKSELKACLTNPLTVQLYADIVTPMDLTKGLIGYYIFEYNTNDSSISKNHGIDFTHGIFVQGIKGNALSFDGSTDYIQLTNTLNASKGLSFSFWINSKGATLTENNGTVIAKYSMAGKRSFHVTSFGHHSNLRNHIHVSYYPYSYTSDSRDWTQSDLNSNDLTYWGNANNWTIVNPKSLELNKWIHCVVNCSDTEVSIWLNEELTTKKKREYTSYNDPTDEPTYIGNIPVGGDGSNNHLNGALDELRVYNRSLTSSEIKYLYTNKL